MTKAVLHIGTEKTGSTSVQRFLKVNRKALRARGILFPRAFGDENQMALPAAALSVFGPMRRKMFKLNTWDEVNEFRERLRRDLRNELQVSDYHTALMSAEHCSSRLLADTELVWLLNFLQEFFSQIRIVVYIRRQDEFLLSTYSAHVKAGGTNRLRIPEDELLENRYNYWNLLSRWARVFGRQNICCRRFERRCLVSGDIVADYIDATGIGRQDYHYPKRLNASLDATSLEFLRLLNAHIPRVTADGINERRHHILSALAERSDGPLATLPEEELRAFLSHFTDSNRNVAEEYFGDTASEGGDPLFGAMDDPRPRTTERTLTVKSAVEICAFLLDRTAPDTRKEMASSRIQPP
jgi:hypothetical protein